MTDDVSARLGRIEDRLEIEDLLTRYCRAIDQQDWELLDTVYTRDAWADYTASGGIQGHYPEIRKWLAEVLPMFPMTQHLVTNKEIRLDGDRATARTALYNPMGRPRAEGGLDLFFVGGYYVDELVRTPAGWRIARRIEEQTFVDLRS